MPCRTCAVRGSDAPRESYRQCHVGGVMTTSSNSVFSIGDIILEIHPCCIGFSSDRSVFHIVLSLKVSSLDTPLSLGHCQSTIYGIFGWCWQFFA
jgi:hypothetical protein